MLTTLNISSMAMAAFSRSLDTISNNVTNMNTPGFKGARTQFAAQFTHGQNGSAGGGVTASATVVDFKTGDPTATQDPLNLYIDGATFFVLKDAKGDFLYTKDGQFAIVDGFLVGAGGARVQGLDANGALADISVGGSYAFRAPAPSQTIKHAAGSRLSTTPGTGGAMPVATSQAFKVYDTGGGIWDLTVRYTKENSPTSENKWKVEIRDKNDAVIATDTLTFNATGTGVDDPTFSFKYRPGGSAALELSLVLDYSTLTSASYGANNSPQLSADGNPRGSVTGQAFTEDGKFEITYSAGEKNTSQSIALARFDSVRQLEQVAGGTFVNNGGPLTLEYAGRNGESLRVGFVERSNVDLSAAFNELIITQRGFQAASQLGSTAGAMLDALLSRRGA